MEGWSAVSPAISDPDFTASTGPTQAVLDYLGPLTAFINDPTLLLVKLFRWYFDNDILGDIARYSNRHATSKRFVQKVVNGKKRREIATDDVPDSERVSAVDVKYWVPMTAGSLLTWFGVLLIMKGNGFQRPSHAWMTHEGLGSDVIRKAMTKNVWLGHYRHLTFYDVSLPISTPTKNQEGFRLRKLHRLIDHLRIKSQDAYNPHQKLTVDESMVKVCSRFCPMVQIMPRKPIKCGVKIWSLADASTSYLLNFSIYCGRCDFGASTIYDVVWNTIPPKMNNQNHIVYTDNLFTGEELFTDLVVKRGIFACGTLRRPVGIPEYSVRESKQLPRGWTRIASKQLTGDRHLQATAWMDNKLVRLLHTAHISETKAEVPETSASVKRWVKSRRCHQEVECSRALIEYATNMGGVDRLDKRVSYGRLWLKSRLRYHRQIFLWLFSSMSLSNVRVLFELTYPDVDSLKKKAQRSDMGWSMFLQIELGNALIREGGSGNTDRLSTKKWLTVCHTHPITGHRLQATEYSNVGEIHSPSSTDKCSTVVSETPPRPSGNRLITEPATTIPTTPEAFYGDQSRPARPPAMPSGRGRKRRFHPEVQPPPTKHILIRTTTGSARQCTLCTADTSVTVWIADSSGRLRKKMKRETGAITHITRTVLRCSGCGMAPMCRACFSSRHP